MKTASGGTRCNSKNINGEKFEKKFIEFLKGYNKDILLIELKKLLSRDGTDKIRRDNVSIEKLIDSKSRGLKRLFDRLKLIDDEEVAKMILDEIKIEKNEIKKLEEDKHNLLNKESELAIDQSQVLKVVSELDDFNKLFNDLNLEDKRKMLHSILDTIELLPDGKFEVNFNVKKN